MVKKIIISTLLLTIYFSMLLVNINFVINTKKADKDNEQTKEMLIKYEAENVVVMRDIEDVPLYYVTFDMTTFELIEFYLFEPDYRKGFW